MISQEEFDKMCNETQVKCERPGYFEYIANAVLEDLNNADKIGMTITENELDKLAKERHEI